MKRNGIVEELDSAFEWLVVLLTLSFSAFFSYLTWLWKTEKEPIISLMRLELFPLVIIVLAWILKIVIENQNWKMFLRKLAWFWGMMQLWWMLSFLTVLYTVGLGLAFFLLALLLMWVFILPIFFLYRKVIDRYKESLSEILFWKSMLWDWGASAFGWIIVIFYYFLTIYISVGLQFFVVA